ncbi:magnesium transporter CorA family protein [Rheinheimera sp.]|uniref:magnesium transporter CorA family protein n=1 Tax=Rheinheimera sp. TaxID=1869214 RepID=UPI00307D58A7
MLRTVFAVSDGQQSEAPMIELHQYCPEQQQWQIGDFATVRLPLLQGSRFWINLTDATALEQQQVLELFRIHPVIAEDFLRDRHPPKLDTSNSFQLLILRGFAATDFSDYPGHCQLNLLFNEQVMLMKFYSPQPAPHILLPFSALKGLETKGWAKQYIHAVAASYLHKLIQFEEDLGELEDAMQSNGNDQRMAQIMKFRSVFRKIDRNLAYQKEIFADLLYEEDDSHPFRLLFEGVELRDFYEKFERLHSMVQMYYDQLSDLVDGYMSTSSHQINEKMKVLTILTAVFVPLTFIAGVYGMNFKYMPELETQWGYHLTLAVMLGVAIGLLVWFKVRRWW